MWAAGILFIAAASLLMFNEQLVSAASGGPFEFFANASAVSAGFLLAMATERAWRALDLGTAMSRARRRNDPGPN
jgi:hypothetical protein